MTPTPRWTAKHGLFPRQDLSAWSRDRHLARWLRSGDIETLDAGFGNGALTLKAYQKGNRVLGVSYRESEVQSASALFDELHVPRNRVTFKGLNIRDLHTLDRTFDQIICTDTLHYLPCAAAVVRTFSDLLRPGGTVILSVPNASHPITMARHCDATDAQVGRGYTVDGLMALLDGSELRVTETMGLGSPWLTTVSGHLQAVQEWLGTQVATPLVLAALPLARMDHPNPTVPLTFALHAERMRPRPRLL